VSRDSLQSSRTFCHFYYLLFGMVGTGMLPALVRSFENDYELTHGHLGVIMGIGAAFQAVGALVGGRWSDVTGARPAFFAAMALCVASALGVAATWTVVGFIVAVTLFRFSNGLAQVVNPVVGRLYASDRAAGINLLHGFQGLGRIVSPLLVAGLLGFGGGWRICFGASAALFGVCLPLAYRYLHDPRDREGDLSHASQPKASVRDLLKRKALWLGAAGFVFSAGCTGVLVLWTPTLLETEAGLPRSWALASLTFMMAGFTLIRFAGRFVDPVLRNRFIVLSPLALLGGSLLLTRAQTAPTALAVCLVLGFSFGAHWPSLAAAVYDRVPAHHGVLTGVFMTSSMVGSVAFSCVTGYLGDAYGLRRALLVAPVSSVVFAFCYVGLIRRKRASSLSFP
jgi:MFS family permease